MTTKKNGNRLEEQTLLVAKATIAILRSHDHDDDDVVCTIV